MGFLSMIPRAQLDFIITVSAISTKTDGNFNFNIGFSYFVSIVSTTKSPPVQEHRLLQKIQKHKPFRKTEVNKTGSTYSEQKFDSSKSLYLQKYIPVASFFDENVVFPHFKLKKSSQSVDHMKSADIILRLAQRYSRMNKTNLFKENLNNIPEKDLHTRNKKHSKNITTERNHNGRYKPTIFIDTQDIVSEKDSLRNNKKKRKDSTVERNHTGQPKSTILTDTQGTITEKHSLRSNKKKRTESTTVKWHTGIYKSTIIIDTENSIAEEDALKNVKKKKIENRHRHHHSPKEKRVDHQLKHFNKKSTNIVQNNKHKNEKSEDIATFSNRSFSAHSLYVEPIINHCSMNFSREKEKKLLSSTNHVHKPSLQGHLRNKTKNHSNLSYKKHNTTHSKAYFNTTGKRKEENAHKSVRNSNSSDKKFSKNVNNNSNRITQLTTPSSISIEEIENPKPGTYKHANNTTSGLLQPSHYVKDDVKMYYFLKQIFKDKLQILHTVEKKTSDVEWKIKLKEIANSYEYKFKEFIEDIGSRKVASKSGNERVILNSIDMSNRLVMRVVLLVADEMDKKGVLRNNETSNIIEKKIKHKTKSEMKEACTYFGVCRRSTAFIDFIASFLTTLLSLDDVKFEKAYNFTAKHIQNTDFTNTIGYYADKSFKETAKKYDNMHVMYKRGIVEMLRNIIVNRNTPLVIYGDNNKFDVMKTLAFIEIIKILENEVPDTEENETEWRNLTTELNIYRMGHAVNIEGTMAGLVSHIKKVVDRTDSKSWTSILTNLSTIT